MIWDKTNEQDRRILETIRGLENESAILGEWQKQIRQVINFPFIGEVAEGQEYDSIVQYGDRLKVHAIDDIDDHNGIIANTRFGRKKVYFPLCDLEGIDLNVAEKNVLFDYSVWFANR